MPRGDGTGPAGLGPMTGRAAGYCADYPAYGGAASYGNVTPYDGVVTYGAPYGGPYGPATTKQ